ncbi:MAG: biotin--[acetyl-CoA-carboxylase] ligase [Deltaproteobacteria bacterium]|jgi:BirA family biotin operon repressor/biotin-[acetyl-CoA-carboxylase] ligase|nr:biotin--[acetyl-CoA-carboxylase] ligase [Deltaproteobacteria bacterium]MBP6831543.1 biotin--[acetyl-CoA-carboxylase] ligase [Deltaproteobacteria bacterium]
MDDLLGFVSPPGCRLGRPLILKALTGSTNDDARALANAGAGHGTVVLADAQTAGRGRLGRAWSSPAGENLYLSVVWRAGLDAIEPPLLALGAGLAVSEALDGFTPTPTAVKWPNDVRHRGRKLAGLLAEAIYRGTQPSAVILGLGVNVRGAVMPDAIAEIATSLRIVRGDDPGRAAVLSSLLEHLDATLGRLCAEGFVAIRQRLIERCENIGARVSIGEVSGVAIDIDPTGALRVRDDQGVVHAVRAGEIR